MPINRHFDLAAPMYDRLIPPTDPERLRALLDLPEKGAPPARGWMLDAAGGTGRHAAQFLPLVERLTICDLSGPMLRQAIEKGCRFPARARVSRLPFPDGSFQRILVVDAFHHFDDQPGAAREFARVLGTGGRLVIEEPDIRRLGVKLIAIAELLAWMGSRFRSPHWMRDLLVTHGLEARIEVDGATAWIVATKLFGHHSFMPPGGNPGNQTDD